MNIKNNKKGFTLIEILIVIGIIAVLATIVIIAINPARQFAQARNTQRVSNVNTLLNAVGQNLADNKGVFTCSGSGNTPDATVRHIGTGGGAMVNLTCLVPTYIPTAIPMDPTNGTATDTQYTITYDGIRYTLCAPNGVEAAIPGSTAICVTR